ncbi:HK97 gp10 family phage protein [Pasteurella langaaensis DSM 22999]|uniref:HK97 gp10 family phage protein n=1 Tax=Alitibacter langaaensis DSM 22999 TaxID=1122935 RepID=A0A2U0SNW6_9PAST|nr:HK97-gp10 family putative phage morphogenesis protein [Pasteurella langaaensis]PVX33032.1 HK97 gp10 family phage protein [Pasteurella langaaensis DSM 22999]
MAKVKVQGLTQVIRRLEKMKKTVKVVARPAIRKALNAGAKELEKTIKPTVPVIARSTNTGQKGTIKNNIRHKTRVAKDGLSGYTIISVKRAKGKRMARVGENTHDRTDPFYWWMVEYGTKNMKGRHFMAQGAERGKPRALKVTREKFIEEIQKIKF